MRLRNILLLLLAVSWTAAAKQYYGRVVDEQGRPISYATVYPILEPVIGTATNDQGFFIIDTEHTVGLDHVLDPQVIEMSDLVVSYIGYGKQVVPLRAYEATTLDTGIIVLHEQPIALEETVVAAKASKQRNKRKQMATLLHQVMQQMDQDFSSAPAQYRIVSDVRMDSEGEAWGMEQMIASVVLLPEAKANMHDSTQFVGEYCKRYFRPNLRILADTILSGNSLEKIDKNLRKTATAIDSGVVVHHALFSAGNIRNDFQDDIDDLSHWTVSNESEGETVLTHTYKRNILGMFKLDYKRHYILDSETLSVKRFSERAEIHVNIPFGYKLNADQLQLLNLLNMSDQEIEKFRLRKAHAIVSLNTIYQRHAGHTYILEKNLRTDATITGTKKAEIPLAVNATQRVTSLHTEGIRPLRQNEITHRVPRQIVEIY